MAKATKQYAPALPAPPPAVCGITLELSVDEADFLTSVLGRVQGGLLAHSSIYGTLHDLGWKTKPKYTTQHTIKMQKRGC